jgi:uncharacterized protein (TIGR04255 family)
MVKEYVLKNAPLVEVVAEVRWSLKNVLAGPGTAIDPFFDIFKRQFGAWAEREGWSYIEQMVPDQMPAELLPHKPHFRFREGKDSYPLFQIGPGLFAINVVPPYGGWSKFRKTVTLGLRALYRTYPLSDNELLVTATELRYINAFVGELTPEPYHEFITKHLSVDAKLPITVADKYLADPSDLSATVIMQFKSKRPEESEGTIRIAPGTAHGRNAIIVDLISRRTESKGKSKTAKELIEWFDSAHKSIEDWFKSITSKELYERMGPEIAVGGEK